MNWVALSPANAPEIIIFIVTKTWSRREIIFLYNISEAAPNVTSLLETNKPWHKTQHKRVHILRDIL